MLGYIVISTGLAIIFICPIIHILERIAEGIFYMADLEAAALADLAGAVNDAVTLIAKMAADLKAAGSPIDHSADIEAIKQKLADAVTSASAPAAPAPAAPPA